MANKMTPAEDLATSISGLLGWTLSSNLFVFEEPQTPDKCLTLYDTGGFNPDLQLDYPSDVNQNIISKPTIMIRIRHKRGAYRKAYEALSGVIDIAGSFFNTKLNCDYFYLGVWQEGDIHSLGTDENQRPLLTVNFRIHRTLQT